MIAGKVGEGNGTPLPVFLPGKSHGRRSLVGCSPWGLEESDTTERLHFHFSLACIGEGNGNPHSCLENPRDRGAWWAAVYGVVQSRTRLKLLSSIALHCIIHYTLTLFFIYSRSLLNLFCLFSILVSRLFICNSILISRFWIIFTIIFQNSLSGRFPISSSSVWFGGHLSCFFTCWVFLCLFILFILLSLGWAFCILAVCGVLFIVEFLHCGWGCISGLSSFLG